MTEFHRDRILGYLDRCRMPEGGYCHFHDPESGAGFSNVGDTFWALGAYRFLEESPPVLARTREWLRQEFDRNETLHNAPSLAWAMEGLLLSGEKLGQGDRNLLLRDAALLLSEKVPDSEIPSLLEDLRATLELRDRLEIPLAQGERALLAGLLRQGRKNESPVPLPELRDRIFLGRYAGASDDRNLVGNLPEEREYRDVIFGYVLVPGTSRSDLFILRAGLSIRKEPLLPSEILAMKKMLLLCQGREGGFGPVGGAIPTLKATWTALDLLRRLLPGATSPAGR